MQVSVKKVDTRDMDVAKTLLYLQKKCLPYDSIYPVNVGHWWVVYNESLLPVGFAGMVRSKHWLDCGYMCRAGVIEEYQGHGIQKRLIKARMQYAKKLGWNWLITDTTENPASSNSLISQGFRLYNPTEPWANKHSLYWRKHLNAIQRPRSKKSKTCGVLKKILRSK